MDNYDENICSIRVVPCRQPIPLIKEGFKIDKSSLIRSNEYITEAWLNWMSFGARQYDPQLGRFLGVDPMAAQGGQDMLSPYHAMGDNPVSGTDPGGMLPQNLKTGDPRALPILPAGAVIGDMMAINPANFGLGSLIDALNNMISEVLPNVCTS